MGSQTTTTFEIGDSVVYVGSNDRIGHGTCGVVISKRKAAISNCTVAVKYDGREGMLSSLEDIDDSHSSLWCDPRNLQLLDEDWLNEAKSACFDLTGLL